MALQCDEMLYDKDNQKIILQLLTAEYSDGHRSVHEEEHVEEKEPEVGENLGAVVADVVVQGADQQPHQHVREQAQVHERLEDNISI